MYQSAEEMVKESQQPEVQLVHLAEVTSLDKQGRAKVKFFGEDTESGKTYTYIDGYVPKVGDKVAMVAQGKTFIIIGAVIKTEVVVKYALVDHEHTAYALVGHTHDTYALTGHNHDSVYSKTGHAHDDYAPKEHTHDYAASEHTHAKIENTNRTVELSGNVLTPSVTETIDLGSSSKRFQNAYIEKVYGDAFKMGNYELSPSKIYSNSRTNQYVEVKDNVFTPSVNELFDLGSASYQFNKVYAAQMYLDGRRWYPYRVISDLYPDARYIDFNGDSLKPNNNGAYYVGTPNYQFKGVYAQNVYVNGSAVTTSDKRKKKFVRKLADKYVELFKKLRPVTFTYKNGTSGRTHTGFIAQEVEQAMADCGITNEEFGGLVIQDNGEYGLRYEEFIALQTAVIQDLQKKVEELERRVNNDRV